MPHRERHRSERIGWLRAAVLGANDGVVSTASLVVGVAAAEAARQNVLVAGVAELVAGALQGPQAFRPRPCRPVGIQCALV
jgi:vacuolar iron transporter family protein